MKNRQYTAVDISIYTAFTIKLKTRGGGKGVGERINCPSCLKFGEILNDII